MNLSLEEDIMHIKAMDMIKHVLFTVKKCINEKLFRIKVWYYGNEISMKKFRISKKHNYLINIVLPRSLIILAGCLKQIIVESTT